MASYIREFVVLAIGALIAINFLVLRIYVYRCSRKPKYLDMLFK
jgi:hypothetical protein